MPHSSTSEFMAIAIDKSVSAVCPAAIVLMVILFAVGGSVTLTTICFIVAFSSGIVGSALSNR